MTLYILLVIGIVLDPTHLYGPSPLVFAENQKVKEVYYSKEKCEMARDYLKTTEPPNPQDGRNYRWRIYCIPFKEDRT